MTPTAKILIGLGLLLIVAGIITQLLGKFPLGRLPGDFTIERENFKFYFPLSSSLLVSLILSLLFYFFGTLKK